MRIQFKETFGKDLRGIKNKEVLNKVREIIVQVEQARTLKDIANLKKLKGGNDYYRIRIGDYRLGIVVQENIVSFVRCLNRREIYRYFP